MSNQIQATGAVKIRSLTGALTASAGVVTSVPLGGANGVATLDSLGKVPLSQLPASVVTYLGTWNAATNTPTLANGTGDVGDLYICNVAGTVNFGAGPITFAVGDWVIYSGTTWQKSSGASGTVTSVAATVPTGLTVTGSPITTSGTLAFSLTAGYTIPLSTQLVPSGGTAGQLLAKNSATNYDTVWIDNYTEQLRDTVKAAVAINKGQAVYISGANGTNQIVSLASNASEATSSKTLGLAAQNFAINDIGQIITEGLLAGIDTSTATAGDPVWLGVDGNLIFGLTNKPVAPAHLVYIGVVTRVQAINGEIYIKIQNGFELQELHNVLITSPANGNILQYDSATSLWKNVAGTTTNIAEGTNLYYTDARARLALSATTPLSYNNTTGVFSISQANTTTDGYLSLTDWNTFNGKQAQLNGTGFIKASGTTISYDNSTYLTTSAAASTYVPYTGATGNVNLGFNTLTTVQAITNGVFINQLTGTANSINLETATSAIAIGGTGYVSLLSNATDSLSIYFSNTTKVAKFLGSGLTTARTYTLPDASGTVALTSDLSSYLPLTGGTLTTSVGNTLTIINSGTGYGLYVQAGAAYFQNGASIQGAATLVSVTASSMLKTNASGVISAAVAGTDYQAPLTNPVTGTGTTNYLPKFTAASTIGNSLVYDNGTNVLVGTATAHTNNYKFGVYAGNYTGIEVRANTEASINLTTGTGTATPFTEIFNSYGNFAIRQNNTDYSTFVLKYNGATNVTTFDTAGAEAMRINANRTVSIGNTNSTYNLDVTGTGRFTGALTASGGTFSSATNATLHFLNTATGGKDWWFQSYTDGKLYLGVNGAFNNLIMDGTTGAATFSSSITTNSGATFNGISLNTYISPIWANTINFASTTNGNDNGWINYVGYNNGNTQFRDLYIGNGKQSAIATFIGSTGNVGIGTTSPATILELGGATNKDMGIVSTQQTSYVSVYDQGMWLSVNRRITDGTFSNTGLSSANIFLDGSSGGSAIQFRTAAANNTAPTERMRITSGGHLLIGTTTDITMSSVWDSGVTRIGGGGLFFSYANNTDNFMISQNYYVNSGGNDARINTGGASNIFMAGGSMYFRTTASSTAGSTITWNNPLTLTSGGNVLIGTTSDSPSDSNSFYYNISGKAGVFNHATGTGSGQQYIGFTYAGAYIGSIAQSGTTGISYNTSSDYRLKQDLKEFNGLSLISAIKTYDYQWKTDKSRMYGVMAHELQEIIPYAVTGEKDGEQMQGVDYSKIVPILIKSIQELQERILILEK